MATGPFQSKLDPHGEQIAALRACKPPATYARIAAILKQQHQLDVHRATIQHFVKVRCTRRLHHLTSCEEKGGERTGKQKPTGMVPLEVQMRISELKQQPAPAKEERQPYLPPDGRLTYKEKL